MTGRLRAAWRGLERVLIALTGSSPRQCLVYTFGTVALAWLGVFFFLGVFIGADAANSGFPLEPLLGHVWAVEQEVWANFGSASPVQRTVGGLFHWAIFVSVATSALGVHVGFAVPGVDPFLGVGSTPVLLGLVFVGALNAIKAARMQRGGA